MALCHSQDQARQVQARLAEWLAPKGLAFNLEKTKIVSLGAGFDFLGFNVRRYRQKLLIKPSNAAIKRVRSRLSVEMRRLRGSNAPGVLAKISPIVRGWAAYYRGVVSKKTFSSLDNHLVEAHLQVGQVQPQEQAEVLGYQPILRPVQPRQG